MNTCIICGRKFTPIEFSDELACSDECYDALLDIIINDLNDEGDD